MGRNFASGDSPDQGRLMPADPREWLPPRHLAWSVLEQVAEMDLSGFEAAYRSDGQGGKAYHPAMMTALLLYCYCKGKRSSRDIEAATWDDVGARVICGNLHPDHSTCAAFVRRHAAAVAGLLPESVRACAREGLVSLEVTAGDGTKLKANASMASNVTAEQLQEQIAELEAFIDADMEAWIAQILDAGPDGPAPAPAGTDADAGTGAGAGRTGGTMKKMPKRARQTLDRRKAARAQLDARQAPDQGMLEARRAGLAARLEQKEAAAARYEQAAAARLEHWERKAAACAPGKRPRGRKPGGPDACPEVRRARAAAASARAWAEEAAGPAPAPDPAAKVNTADPASRVMPLKKGGYDQLHNVQALATARSQVILAVTRHDSPCDVRALTALLAEARRVLDAAGIAGRILKALFDAGYASDANFTAITEPELYVAVTREARQAGRSQDGRDPARLPSWDDMTARLGTPEGKELYKKRAATIEPVFAQLTSRLGRTLHYRGSLLDAELALWAASHNILKAIKARTARQARHAVPAAA
jgi:transposase